MDNSGKSTKIAAGVAIILMLGAITWGSWNARINGNLKDERDQAKLRTESLLSEKLMVEKDLASANSQIKNLLRENETLSRNLGEAKNMSDLKDGSINQLQRQLASNKKSYAELKAAYSEAEGRLASINQQLAQLQQEKLAANQETEALRSQIDNLRKELAMAHSAYYDKVLVESTRGKNDKLVVKASRTKKLRATVMVPSNLKEIEFQVFDPSGKLISSSPENGVLAVNITQDNNSIASSSDKPAGQTFKKAEMTFLPKRKLVAGTYRIEVLSEKLSVGDLQVRLR